MKLKRKDNLKKKYYNTTVKNKTITQNSKSELKKRYVEIIFNQDLIKIEIKDN